MRTVTRNSFARQTITAERVHVVAATCRECGQQRGDVSPCCLERRPWLYRFHVDDDQGSRHSGPLANGLLFCSRGCAETYLGQSFDETRTLTPFRPR